ncbi:MAG: monovalent cation/H+ antiporter complex subunit F [Balneolaceae bacterium]
MTDFFLYSTVLLTIIIAVPMVRVVKGPTVYDRLMGTNAIASKTIVLICLIGYMFDRIDMFLDITLAYAILGFIGTMAIAKFISTQSVEENT